LLASFYKTEITSALISHYFDPNTTVKMLPTSILLLATAIGITAAAPVDSVLESRICGKVLLPTQLIQLKAAAPNTAFPNTALTDKSVLISQDINSAGMLSVSLPLTVPVLFPLPPRPSEGQERKGGLSRDISPVRKGNYQEID
jgi:hypothetical protein